jgi:hypothetical protein
MRNTSSLYYPFMESVLSILPLVDEFVIALGDNSPEDTTEETLRNLNDPKIKIIHTQWDLNTYKQGTVYACQTDIAKSHCTGDWLFYLQSDEVVHEKYLEGIKKTCQLYLDDDNTEGFLFGYKHFWGDYNHYVESHAWYPQEIRIIRNRPDIHSFGDAQSFRVFSHFDGMNYRDKSKSRALYVRRMDAEIYHYGWVRPPSMMQQKSVVMDGAYYGAEEVQKKHSTRSPFFDYGNMNNCTPFKGTHPEVLKEFIRRFNWGDQLHYTKNYKPLRPPLKHETLKYRTLSWIEKNLLKGNLLFGYKNWELID